LKLDITKASSLLEWGPACSVPQAVADTMAWYKAYADGSADMKTFTLKQIDEYRKRAQMQGIIWAGNGAV